MPRIERCYELANPLQDSLHINLREARFYYYVTISGVKGGAQARYLTVNSNEAHLLEANGVRVHYYPERVIIFRSSPQSSLVGYVDATNSTETLLNVHNFPLQS
jgi:hypothetical protein